jgi:5-methyltetrahydrofolate--homocysteine methyltransferase
VLSGQTVSASWHSVRHVQPLAVGLNFAMGTALIRPYPAELARVAAETHICCYLNPHLPNPMSETGFEETPEVSSRLLGELARDGPLNRVGDFCGTTPEHFRAIAEAVQ